MKLCEIYDEGCSSLSFDYTCKIRDGTELEMETQSDTRHNLKTTPTQKLICDNVYSKQAKKKQQIRFYKLSTPKNERFRT